MNRRIPSSICPRALFAGAILPLIVCALSAPAAPVTIKPAQLWPDDTGEHVNAHCGDIVKVGDRYYWFGEYRNARRVQTIVCYISSDLAQWHRDALVLTPNSSPDVAQSHLERPKVIYNERTKKYVMWMHRENLFNYNEAQCAVASCDTIDGDYNWQGAFNPNGNMSRDCTLFKDDDGSAYFLSSSHDNADMVVYKLTDDYLKVASQVAVLSPGGYREAPCLFKRDGIYYLITSFCTGTWSNTQYYSTARSMTGPWSPPRRLAGDDTWNTYYSQGACVLAVAGSETTSYLYCADRWQVQPMRHIWLPMQFAPDGSIAPLRWADSWTLDAATGRATLPEDDLAPLPNDLARSATITSDYKNDGALARNPNGDRSYSHLAGHQPAAANDGDPSTSWIANDNLPGHWWKVDLGGAQSIAGISVAWYRGNGDYAFHIDVSPDGQTWETKFQRTRGEPSERPTTRPATQRTRPAPPVREIHADNVRFIRVTVDDIPSGYDWPGIAECKVLSPHGVDLAANKPATADSYQPDTTPAAAIDGNIATAWTIDDRGANHWLKLDLGKPADLAGCRICWEAPGFWYRYKIETSADDQQWSVAVDQTKNQEIARRPTHAFTASGVRYVRLTITDYERGCWPGVRAFELMPR